MPPDEDLLADQIEFYRARAPEYDDWWQRRGRYDRGEVAAAEWQDQIRVIDGALDRFGARGDVLELAGGTGWWTQRLAETAGRLTVIDASPEVLEINRNRVGKPNVEYEVADLFQWSPSQAYDVVFFSFWLSHVPRSRFDEFWEAVRGALGPDGRVFLIDNRHEPGRGGDPFVVQYGEDVQLRTLSDGSRHRVVKVHHEPGELGALLAERHWEAHLEGTPAFIFGSASPRR